MSKRQELARKRNWLKARLLSIPSFRQTQILTTTELERVDKIIKEFNQLMFTWDINSKILSELNKHLK
jgi:hypothetical protein